MNKEYKQEKYYSLEDIKEIFKVVRETNKILNEEYEIFCESIIYLPKNIVDKINKEVYFVIFSSDEKYCRTACFVNIEKDLKNKKGIIIITPFLFKPNALEPDAKKAFFKYKINENRCEVHYPKILHEVAHFIKRHRDTKDQNEYDKLEKEADKLVKEWIMEYYRYKRLKKRLS